MGWKLPSILRTRSSGSFSAFRVEARLAMGPSRSIELFCTETITSRIEKCTFRGAIISR